MAYALITVSAIAPPVPHKWAINQLLELPKYPLSQSILELLVNWRIRLGQKPLAQDDEELFMNLSPAYLRWREETLQEGKQEGRQEGKQEGKQEGQRVVVENLLKVRFGLVDDELSRIIEPLLQLPLLGFHPFAAQLGALGTLD